MFVNSFKILILLAILGSGISAQEYDTLYNDSAQSKVTRVSSIISESITPLSWQKAIEFCDSAGGRLPLLSEIQEIGTTGLTHANFWTYNVYDCTIKNDCSFHQDYVYTYNKSNPQGSDAISPENSTTTYAACISISNTASSSLSSSLSSNTSSSLSSINQSSSSVNDVDFTLNTPWNLKGSKSDLIFIKNYNSNCIKNLFTYNNSSGSWSQNVISTTKNQGFWIQPANSCTKIKTPILGSTNTDKLLTVNKGWSLVGFGENISSMAPFDINCIDRVWGYKNSNWYTYKNGETNSRYNKLSSIDSEDGTWIKALTDTCKISYSNVSSSASTIDSEVSIVELRTSIGSASEETLINKVIPGEKSTIQLIDFTGSVATVNLNTIKGIKSVTVDSISIDSQTITFNVPNDVIDGNLTVKSSIDTTNQITYSVIASSTPIITQVSPFISNIGSSVTVTGENIEDSSVSLIFNTQHELNISNLTVANNKVNFRVPASAKSGYIYLKNDDMQTNKIYLSVARDIKLKVELGDGLNFSANSITFDAGGTEYTLASDYTTSIPVQNGRFQYAFAHLNNQGDDYPVLYAKVVLPDETTEQTLNAQSTAIAWIFLALNVDNEKSAASVRSLYNTMSSLVEVKELGNYIQTLQKTNFTGWTKHSDTTLITKIASAAKAVLSQTKTTKSHRNLTRAPSYGTVISTDPRDSDIGVKISSEGNIYIDNDTKLYMSVEARAMDSKKIINNYTHVQDKWNSLSLVGPKTGKILGLSNAHEVYLYGENANLEILIGSDDFASISDSKKRKLVIELNGLANLDWWKSILDITFSHLTKKHMDLEYGSSNSKLVFDVVSELYGRNFWIEFIRKIGAQGGKTELVKTFLYDPFAKSLSDCLQLPRGTTCKNLVGAIKHISKDSIETITQNILLSAGEKVVKKVKWLVPILGQITAIVEGIETVGEVADIASIKETSVDMADKPSLINASVNFNLAIENVEPICLAIKPSDTISTFFLRGKGLTDPDVKVKFESYGTIATEVLEAKSSLVAGKILVTTFDSKQLLLNSYVGNLHNKLFLENSSTKNYYDKEIRVVAPDDKRLYVDSLQPIAGEVGDTIVFKGCGFNPLVSGDVKVSFQSIDDRRVKIYGDVIEVGDQTLKVKVPEKIIGSGSVCIEVNPASSVEGSSLRKENCSKHFQLLGVSYATVDTLSDGLEFYLKGSLKDALCVKFVDSNNKTKTYCPPSEDKTYRTMKVKTPDGLEAGAIDIYVSYLEDGTIYELTLPLVRGSSSSSSSSSISSSSSSTSSSSSSSSNSSVISSDSNKTTVLNMPFAQSYQSRIIPQAPSVDHATSCPSSHEKRVYDTEEVHSEYCWNDKWSNGDSISLMRIETKSGVETSKYYQYPPGEAKTKLVEEIIKEYGVKTSHIVNELIVDNYVYTPEVYKYTSWKDSSDTFIESARVSEFLYDNERKIWSTYSIKGIGSTSHGIYKNIKKSNGGILHCATDSSSISYGNRTDEKREVYNEKCLLIERKKYNDSTGEYSYIEKYDLATIDGIAHRCASEKYANSNSYYGEVKEHFFYDTKDIDGTKYSLLTKGESYKKDKNGKETSEKYDRDLNLYKKNSSGSIIYCAEGEYCKLISTIGTSNALNALDDDLVCED